MGIFLKKLTAAIIKKTMGNIIYEKRHRNYTMPFSYKKLQLLV